MKCLKSNKSVKIKKVTQFVQDFLLEELFNESKDLKEILNDRKESIRLEKYMLKYWEVNEEYEICTLIKNTFKKISEKNVKKHTIFV